MSPPKLFIPMTLSLAITEFLCLSKSSAPRERVGLTGGERGKKYLTSIYILFLGHVNAFFWSLRIS